MEEVIYELEMMAICYDQKFEFSKRKGIDEKVIQSYRDKALKFRQAILILKDKKKT